MVAQTTLAILSGLVLLAVFALVSWYVRRGRARREHGRGGSGEEVRHGS